MTKNNRVYIIAEAGVNHNGSLALARKLIDVAAAAGADAVKFQTFRAESLVSGTAPKALYQKKTTGAGESQLAMLRKLELSREVHRQLVRHCRKQRIRFLSTPFDAESVTFLAEGLEVPLLKLSSGEVTNAPLLLAAARTGKPVILSTGMSTIPEIRRALGVLAFGYLRRSGRPSIAAFREAYRSVAGRRMLADKVKLLHCTTEYPAPFIDVNLRAMNAMHAAFRLPVGLSDHTEGIAVSIAAAALGAAVIEKHFTLDRNMQGPDHRASLEPDDLAALVRSIREVEAALGSPLKAPSASERKNIAVARRSLVALEDIGKGELLTAHNVGPKRPGTGMSPFHYWRLIGTRAGRSYRKDDIFGHG